MDELKNLKRYEVFIREGAKESYRAEWQQESRPRFLLRLSLQKNSRGQERRLNLRDGH